MKKTKPQTFELKQKPNQTKEEALAQFKIKTELTNTAVIQTFCMDLPDEFNIQATIQVLEKTTEQIKSGDLSEIEAMLFSQAKALEMMFASLARRARAQNNLLQYETNMRLALKAQNQSRATLQALIQLKQPNQTAFIKQANISHGHQQVNNQIENNLIPQNELLVESKTKMDVLAKAKT